MKLERMLLLIMFALLLIAATTYPGGPDKVANVSDLRDACSEPPATGTIYREIKLSPGEYDLAGTSLLCDERVKLDGQGSTIITSGSDGIVVTSSGSILEGFKVDGNDTNIGIHIKAHAVTLRDVEVFDFDTCVFVDGTSANANSNKMFGVKAASCASNGIKTDGGDANAGTFVALEVINGGTKGIYESSFLGNHYIGGTVEGHDGVGDYGLYVDSSANYSSFVAMYQEGADPVNLVAGAPIALGGNLASQSGFTAERVGRGRAALLFQSDAGDIQVSVPGNGESKAMTFSHKEDRDAQAGAYYSLGYHATWNMWFLGYQGGSGYALRWLGPEATAWAYNNLDPALGF